MTLLWYKGKIFNVLSHHFGNKRSKSYVVTTEPPDKLGVLRLKVWVAKTSHPGPTVGV